MNMTPPPGVEWDDRTFLEDQGKNIVRYHVMTKCWQAGAILTTATYGTYAALRAVPMAKFVRGPIWAVPFILSIAGYPLADSRMNQKPGPPGEIDRAFRIIHNRMQNRVDRFDLLGSIAGTVTLFGIYRTPYVLLSGLAIGTTFGLVSYKVEEFVNPVAHKNGNAYPGWDLRKD